MHLDVARAPVTLNLRTKIGNSTRETENDNDLTDVAIRLPNFLCSNSLSRVASGMGSDQHSLPLAAETPGGPGTTHLQKQGMIFD